MSPLLVHKPFFQRGAHLEAKSRAVEESWRSKHAELSEDAKEGKSDITSGGAEAEEEGIHMSYFPICSFKINTPSFFLCNPTDFNSSPVDLDDLREEDRETELRRGRDTTRKAQAQIKQLLQDQGVDATLPKNQAKQLILQVTNPYLYPLLFSLLSIIVTSTYSFTTFPCLYPHRASEKFVSHKNFTNSVLNGAMMGGPVCTLP